MARPKKTQDSAASKKPQVASQAVQTARTVKDDGDTISVTYVPGPGDPDETEVFGQKVYAGEAFDIPAKHAEKVRGNPYLSMKGEKVDKRPAPELEGQEVVTFDGNVASQRSQEYLEGNKQFPSSEPGEAERVARAQQMAAELKKAQEGEE